MTTTQVNNLTSRWNMNDTRLHSAVAAQREVDFMDAVDCDRVADLLEVAPGQFMIEGVRFFASCEPLVRVFNFRRRIVEEIAFSLIAQQ